MAAESKDKSSENQSAYLVLGIVFMVLGIGLGGSNNISSGVPFFVLGVVFLAVNLSRRRSLKSGPSNAE